VQIISTSLQADNHASTSSLDLCRLDVLHDAQPTVLKHWKQKKQKDVDLMLFKGCD